MPWGRKNKMTKSDFPTDEEQKRIRRDPIYFINEWLGMELHPGQMKYMRVACLAVPEIIEALNSGDDEYLDELKQVLETVMPGPQYELTRRFLLSCANRYGKSTMVACLQLWYLYCKFGVKARTSEEWFKTEYRTANIAPTSKLTQPVFKAMKAIMTSSAPIQDRATGLISTNKCRIEWFYLEDRTINSTPFKMFFANNSYIEHLSLMGNKGDSLQGLPYGLITYDEAPRSDWLQLEIDDGILGRLTDWIAPLHLLGTPSQVSNNDSLLYYHDLYQEGLLGVNHSYTQEGSLYENTFLTEEQINEAEKMVEHSPYKDQVLHGRFIWGVRNIFDPEHIEDMLDESLNGGKPYEDEHRYVLGVDTAIGKDEFVISVVDSTATPYVLVKQEAVKGNARSPQMHLQVLTEIVEKYRNGNNLEMLIETWNGESARFFTDLPPYIKAFTHCYGAWQPDTVKTDNDNPMPKKTSLIKKADLIVGLVKAMADQKIKVPKDNVKLTRQLQIYRENDKGLPTDRLISLSLAVWLAENTTRRQVVEFQSVEW